MKEYGAIQSWLLTSRAQFDAPSSKLSREDSWAFMPSIFVSICSLVSRLRSCDLPDEYDGPMAAGLKVLKYHHRYQMADVQGIRGGVNPNVGSARSFKEVFLSAGS